METVYMLIIIRVVASTMNPFAVANHHLTFDDRPTCKRAEYELTRSIKALKPVLQTMNVGDDTTEIFVDCMEVEKP